MERSKSGEHASHLGATNTRLVYFNFYFFPAFKEIDRNAPLDLSSIHNDCMELFTYFNMKLCEALVKCVKASLEHIKKRIVR